jgi:hypothetical protein
VKKYGIGAKVVQLDTHRQSITYTKDFEWQVSKSAAITGARKSAEAAIPPCHAHLTPAPWLRPGHALLSALWTKDNFAGSVMHKKQHSPIAWSAIG